MEAVLMNKTVNYKHRNSKRNFLTNRTLFPFPSDDLANFLVGSHFAGGSLMTMPPPSLYNSYPPAVSVLRPTQQPPLLPLPIMMPLNHQHINIHRSSSSSCSNNNIRSSPPRNNKNVKNRGRDQSLTPKKSKNQKKNSKKDETDLVEKDVFGPDPKDLPKDVISKVFCSLNNKSCDIVSVKVDEFSGSVVFTPSPPPSSLPLPTFSLRPKLGCNAQAGVDVGATDSLRRLLRL